jgi:hypothetical protein
MQTKPCTRCGQEKPLSAYKNQSFLGSANCRECAKEVKQAQRKRYRARHPEKVAAIARRSVSKNHYKNPAKSAERRALRRARMRNACPLWVDRDAIASVYAEARRLSEATGIKHEVDHIVPIKGRNVSGLHVPWNLRPFPAHENARKHATCSPVEGVDYWA